MSNFVVQPSRNKMLDAAWKGLRADEKVAAKKAKQQEPQTEPAAAPVKKPTAKKAKPARRK